jgi:hypothetical protein
VRVTSAHSAGSDALGEGAVVGRAIRAARTTEAAAAVAVGGGAGCGPGEVCTEEQPREGGRRGHDQVEGSQQE